MTNIDKELSNTAVIISDTENDFFGNVDLPTASVPISDSEDYSEDDSEDANIQLKRARKIRGLDWKPPKDFKPNFFFGLEELYKKLENDELIMYNN